MKICISIPVQVEEAPSRYKFLNVDVEARNTEEAITKLESTLSKLTRENSEILRDHAPG